MRVSCLCILLALAASTATAQNPIFNGTFDANLDGWMTSGWTELINAGDFGIPDSPSGTPFAGKINSWGGDWAVPVGSITQTVTMTGNGYLTGELFAAAHHSDPGRNAGIEVLWNGTVVASLWRDADPNLWAASWPWETFQEPVVGIGANELKVQWSIHFAEWTWTAVDNLALIEGDCPNPVSVDFVNPSSFVVPPAPGVQLITIDGHNLNVVTAVSLQNGATAVPGAIQTQGESQITANFDLPETPLGGYDLVLERAEEPGCLTTTTVNDAVTLACTLPSVNSVAPNSFTAPPAPGVQLITIGGNHLDMVSTLSLDLDATSIPGDIVTKSEQEITANFDLPDSPLGAYDLVLSWTALGPCPGSVTANDVLSIVCSVPDARVDTIENDRALSGEPAHTITLHGSNILPLLQNVTLGKACANSGAYVEIDNDGMTPVDADTVSVTFDLTGAEGGRYDVRYTWDTSTCAGVSPAQHDRAFLVYMPEITNGSFEEGCTSPDPDPETCPQDGPSNPAAKHWDYMYGGDPWGGTAKRDGDIWGPPCVNGAIENISGDHYAGGDMGGGSSFTMFQTIAAPNIDENNTSTAPFNVRAELVANGGNTEYPMTVKIRLLDGTENDIEQDFTELAAGWSFDGSNYSLHTSEDYNAIVPSGVTYLTDPPILTIAIEYTRTGGVNDYSGFWADHVYSGTYKPPGCAGRVVWADNDLDGDVDMADFADVQTCITTGLSAPPASLSDECVCLDRVEPSGEITDADVTEFIKCATGPDVPWSQALAPLCQ